MSEQVTARFFVLNAILIGLYSASGSACAEDYFNLSVLETGSPLENTGAIAEYLKNNG